MNYRSCFILYALLFVACLVTLLIFWVSGLIPYPSIFG